MAVRSSRQGAVYDPGVQWRGRGAATAVTPVRVWPGRPGRLVIAAPEETDPYEDETPGQWCAARFGGDVALAAGWARRERRVGVPPTNRRRGLDRGPGIP